MISRFFAPLAAKLGFGLALMLALAIGGLYWRLSSVNAKLDREQLAHRATIAERDRFKDALAFYVQDGQIRTDRGEQALREHETVSADLKRQADRIRTVRVTGTDCKTPAEVLEARGI